MCSRTRRFQSIKYGCSIFLITNFLICLRVLFNDTVGRHMADDTSYQRDYKDFNKTLESMMDFNTVPYKLSPSTICNSSQRLLFGAIVSAPGNTEFRNVIRRTWALDFAGVNSTFAFFAGHSEQDAIDKLIVEGKTYNDMVILDFNDTYPHLTLKLIIVLRWVHENCPNAQYILKADDDMFINVPRLSAYLNTAKPDQEALVGRLARSWRPSRDKKSKWYVSPQEFSGKTYPDFLTGPSYVIGGRAIAKLIDYCTKLPYLFLEDVFFTGLCADKLKMKRIMNDNFENNYASQIKNLKKKIFSIITIHEVPLQYLKTLWQLVTRPEENSTGVLNAFLDKLIKKKG